MSTEGDAAPPLWNEPWSREDGESHAALLYESAFGHAPSGTWSAPGRVNLIGEHTDYNAGLCLPTIIHHRAYVSAALRYDKELHLVTGQADGDGGETWHGLMDDISHKSAPGWAGYAAGVVWALRERGFEGAGLNIAIESCVPVDAGLASSASLEVAVARAANELWRLALDSHRGRVELAESCVDAENLIVGSPTGGLDQYTALFCNDGEALEMDFATTPPTLRDTPLYFPEYGMELLIIDTRVGHNHADGRYSDRFTECMEAAHQLGAANLREVADQGDALRHVNGLTDETLRKRARHVINEIDRVRKVTGELSGTGPAHERLVEVGALLTRGHTSLAVDFDASCPELDLAVRAASSGGALGARMVGGGFGGSAIALVRRAHMDATARGIDAAFIEAGYDRPQFLHM